MNEAHKVLRKTLHKACRENDLDGVKEVFAQAPELRHDADGFSFAAGFAAVEVLSLFLSGDLPREVVDPESKRRPLLRCLSPANGAKTARHLQVARMLLEAGADPDRPGQFQGIPPIRVAAAAQSRELADLLIEHGAHVGIHEAAALYDLETLQEMLLENPERIRELDETGRTPLHALSSSRIWMAGDEEEQKALAAARFLVECGADVDAPQEIAGKYKGTPLWWAISYGRCESLVRWLIPQSKNLSGCMTIAAYLNLKGALEALLEAGAEINARDAHGHTPLQHVLATRRFETAPWLLEHGADPNLQTAKGHSALHLAALVDEEGSLIQALLEAGADVSLEDLEGRSALALAEARDKMKACEVLKAWISASG